MAVRHVRDYLMAVRAIVNQYNMVQQAYAIDKDGDVIETIRDFVFQQDGAKLKFYETIFVDNGRIERLDYSYEYTRQDGYYFRYDKDPKNPKVHRYSHNVCHLHANSTEPRFITHETSFEEIFKFILACYYGEKITDDGN